MKNILLPFLLLLVAVSAWSQNATVLERQQKVIQSDRSSGFDSVQIATMARALVDKNGVIIANVNNGRPSGASQTLVTPVISGGATASGAGSIDLSGSTATFKTPTGAATLSGATTLAANKNFTVAAGTGAVDLSAGTGTFKTTTGANTLSGSTTLAANKDLTMASGTGSVDMSAASGTFKTPTGLVTIGGKMAVKLVATPVAATGAGGGVSGAAALGSATVVRITSDGATKGVKLLTGVAGDVVWVINTSGTAANLFAASGGTLNGASADVGKAIPASKGVLCICTAADTWSVFDMAALAGAAN